MQIYQNECFFSLVWLYFYENHNITNESGLFDRFIAIHVCLRMNKDIEKKPHQIYTWFW